MPRLACFPLSTLPLDPDLASALPTSSPRADDPSTCASQPTSPSPAEPSTAGATQAVADPASARLSTSPPALPRMDLAQAVPVAMQAAPVDEKAQVEMPHSATNPPLLDAAGMTAHGIDRKSVV